MKGIVGTRCVVLGAGGFMGTNLCRALIDAGADVVGYGRRPRDRRVLREVAWLEHEFEDADAIAAAVDGRDLVFHLLGGGTPALSNDDPAADIAHSLLPSVQLIEACKRADVGRVVFASSGGTVYGEMQGTALRENDPTNPITAYGVNKLAVEKYLGLYRRLHGLDSVVLRIANPYGPHQHLRRAQGVVGAFLARALAGDEIEIWNDGSIVRDYIHVDDVVDAMLAAAVCGGVERTFNVGSGVGRSLREVADAVCEVTGRSSDTIRSSTGRRTDVPANVLDATLLTSSTGWTPRVEWMAGLAATAEWMRERLAGEPAA